ncbi:hypothetical protein [Streptomyces phage phiScoe56]|nr:hypothetical protein [Streptomyces phage phiScoe56]
MYSRCVALIMMTPRSHCHSYCAVIVGVLGSNQVRGLDHSPYRHPWGGVSAHRSGGHFLPTDQVGESVSLGTLFSSQGSRASFAVTPCEGSYSVRLALPGCSFWSYSTSFPVGVQLVLPAGGAGPCVVLLVSLYQVPLGCATCASLDLEPSRSVAVCSVRTHCGWYSLGPAALLSSTLHDVERVCKLNFADVPSPVGPWLAAELRCALRLVRRASFWSQLAFTVTPLSSRVASSQVRACLDLV